MSVVEGLAEKVHRHSHGADRRLPFGGFEVACFAQQGLKFSDEHPDLGQYLTRRGIHSPDCMIVAGSVVQHYPDKSALSKIVADVPMGKKRDARAVDAGVV